MSSLMIATAFILMVLAPCMVAMHTGLNDGGEGYETRDPEDLQHDASLRARVPGK